MINDDFNSVRVTIDASRRYRTNVNIVLILGQKSGQNMDPLFRFINQNAFK